MSKSALNSKVLAKSVAEFASDKKAEDVIVLDMTKVTNFCDFFVICSGNSDRHVRAVADGIEEGVESLGDKIALKEGQQKGDWIVLDIGNVVVHIFQKQLRDFYRLEYLWQEAKQVKWQTKKK